MLRRDFLQTGAAVAAANALAPAAAASGTAVDLPTFRSDAPAVLKSYTADDHRRRLQNIGVCTRAVRRCMRRHLVTNYLPAQCAYNLGEYPCVKPWNPDAHDEQELDRLRDHGIQRPARNAVRDEQRLAATSAATILQAAHRRGGGPYDGPLADGRPPNAMI